MHAQTIRFQLRGRITNTMRGCHTIRRGDAEEEAEVFFDDMAFVFDNPTLTVDICPAFALPPTVLYHDSTVWNTGILLSI